jgi:hypothetical protein
MIDNYGHWFWRWLADFWHYRDKSPPKWLLNLSLGKKGQREAQELVEKIEKLLKEAES